MPVDLASLSAPRKMLEVSRAPSIPWMVTVEVLQAHGHCFFRLHQGCQQYSAEAKVLAPPLQGKRVSHAL